MRPFKKVWKCIIEITDATRAMSDVRHINKVYEIFGSS